MTIKTHLPWPVKLALFSVILGLGAALTLWAFNFGRDLTGLAKLPDRQQITTLKEKLAELTVERDGFSATANAAESQIMMERSAQRQLAAQVKALEAENTKLKEDLEFFESLLPAGSNTQGVAIKRLKLESLGPNQVKYRLLLMQGGKSARDFVGSLQFVVSGIRDGKSAMMAFPERNNMEGEREKFNLRFKHYQRMEGVIALPDGMTAETIQVRVFEQGQIRAQQSANL